MPSTSTSAWRRIAWNLIAFLLAFIGAPMMVLGWVICIDTFIPKSGPVTFVWAELVIGGAVAAFGHGLCALHRRIRARLKCPPSKQSV